MNLTKFFNAKYFYQNMKKSAQWLVVFVGLIPILNTIIFLQSVDSLTQYTVISLFEISAFTVFGMFIFPFVLAACLFDFIFKKKSVDFIGSMPIQKSCIFTTNMIGGTLLIACMLFITTLLMWIASLFFSSIVLPFPMLVDYFVLAFVGYVCVFAAASLGFAASGNFITGMVVALLALFLLPFSRQYLTYTKNTNTYEDTYIVCNSKECIPTSYVCRADFSCESHKRKGEYHFYTSEISKRYVTGLPYKLFSIFFWIHDNDDVFSYDTQVLLLTIVETLLYLGIGYFLFKRKKLEVSETSFGTLKTHFLVKSATLVPIIAVFYELVKGNSIFLLLFLSAMLMGYCFIYDLITRKKIEKVGKTMTSFLTAFVLLFGIYYLVNHISYENKTVLIQEKEISKMMYAMSENYEWEEYEVRDKKTIATVLSYLTDTTTCGDMEDLDCEASEVHIFMSGKEYVATLLLTSEEHQKLGNLVKEKSQKISMKGIYAVSLDKIPLSKEERDTVFSTLKKEEDQHTCKVMQTFTLHTYRHHQEENIRVSSCRNIELQQLAAEKMNQTIEKNYPNYGLTYVSYVEDQKMDLLLEYYVEEVNDFILSHIYDPIDVKDDLLVLYVGYYGNFPNMHIYLSAKDEFLSFLEKLQEKAAVDEEYQTWYHNRNEGIYGDVNE